ncbi:MAG: hypothetical protein J6V80_06065 [Clostridia bacterium]|nr:hypothetical protein [Clostridia bacterium]
MSHQHFYSRVPARVSLFNKRDGFDTFAHSLLLEREFILRSLAPAYIDKLDIYDPVKLRQGAVPRVYSQTVLDTGDVAQTAISYIPKDFTGERSSYLAHTLVLTEEERERVFFSPDVDPYTPEMFFTDVRAFNFNDRNIIGNPNLTERAYNPRPLSDGRAVMAKYNPDMMRSFIFSVISSIIGDRREVFFRLPCDDSEASESALELINAVVSILPYSFRQRLSFVSFITTPEAYLGYNLKCVGSNVTAIAPERGVFYDFSTGVITGQSAEYNGSIAHVTFLHSLFDYPTIRNEFHSFVEGIVKAYGPFDFSIESLNEIIFIFWQCSGRYVEDSILPNDEAVATFFDTYGKYREGISTENRVQAYRCLDRYAKAQIAIPDSVFSRLSTFYPTECVEAKAVALDVLLNLIHVDLMRDSLFCFISRYYMGETDGVKAVIISNLSRVFYGGFLQQNILAFFDLYFRREPVHTRDIILDKLLLAIRTPEIQNQIVVFLDRHYAALNPAQKLKVCNTCLEMIPECDMLSTMLVNLINRRIGRDNRDISMFMTERLSESLTYSLVSGDGRMAAIMVDNPGFCEDIVLKHALNQSAGVDLIVAVLAAYPAHKRIEKLLRAYNLSIGMKNSPFSSLINRFSLIPVAVYPSYLWDILNMDKQAETELDADTLASFRQIIIYPAVRYTVHHVFKLGEGSSGVEQITKYAEVNPSVAESAEYRLITCYLSMISKCSAGDTEGAFKLACSLPDSDEVKKDIANYIRKNNYSPDEQDAEVAITYELLMNYLLGENLNLDGIYTRYQMQFEDMRVDDRNLNSIMADKRAAKDAIEHIITCASGMCDASDTIANLVVDDESGLRAAIKEFADMYGPGAGSYLKKKTRESYFAIEEIAEEVIEERNATIRSVGDAVNFLFRRK